MHAYDVQIFFLVRCSWSFSEVCLHKNCQELTFFWECVCMKMWVLWLVFALQWLWNFCCFEFYCSWVVLKFLFFEFFSPFGDLKDFTLWDFLLLDGLNFLLTNCLSNFPHQISTTNCSSHNTCTFGDVLSFDKNDF
jgi:hypothetical protein